MNKNLKATGHFGAIFCVIVWGTTFIISRMLLDYFTPIQTMVLRFIVAYAALWLMYPKWYFKWRDELGFLLMSLFSNTLYFMAENTALTMTLASNVSILVSTAPIFTAFILFFRSKKDAMTRNTLLGILVAFIGVILVVCNGSFVLKLNLAGDFLALGAAISWAIYNQILNEYVGRFSNYLLSRKLMFYGILTSLPLLFWANAPMNWSALFKPNILIGLLFLSIFGNSFCYIAWNAAIHYLGVLPTNIYLYAIPFITMITASLYLHETITIMGIAGTVLIIAGMVISSSHKKTAEHSPN